MSVCAKVRCRKWEPTWLEIECHLILSFTFHANDLSLSGATALSITTFSITTLSITTFSITTLCNECRRVLIYWMSFMLNVIYAVCHLCCISFMLNVVYAEYSKWAYYGKCFYAECRYAECRGARSETKYLDESLQFPSVYYQET
jgi:hypothetical protein